MKKIIFGFKRAIKFFVSIFTSREFAFIYCLIGTIIQISHTYFLTYSISSFDGTFRYIQAVMISAFISSSLLYFVAIADKDNKEESKRVFWAINIFMFMEILINLYYYTRHLIIDVEKWEMFDFFFAVPISCLIPVTIKLYASHIKAKDWIAEFEIENNAEMQTKNIDTTEIQDLIKTQMGLLSEQMETKVIRDIESKMDEWFLNHQQTALPENIMDDKFIDNIKNDFLKTLDSDVAKVFEKHQQLFLMQFENKAKALMGSLINQQTIKQ